MSSGRNLFELRDKLSENQTSELFYTLGVFQLAMATSKNAALFLHSSQEN